MSPKVQSAVAWIISAVIGAGAGGLVMSQFTPPKTEALPPKIEAPPPSGPSRRQVGSALGLLTFNWEDRYHNDGGERRVSSLYGAM